MNQAEAVPIGCKDSVCLDKQRLCRKTTCAGNKRTLRSTVKLLSECKMACCSFSGMSRISIACGIQGSTCNRQAQCKEAHCDRAAAAALTQQCQHITTQSLISACHTSLTNDVTSSGAAADMWRCWAPSDMLTRFRHAADSRSLPATRAPAAWPNSPDWAQATLCTI